MLFSAMLPGPDFALVTKNTLLHSRRAGIMTSFGIGNAVLIHISYCALGLALVISQSIVIFNIIKYIGAIYLFYLGIKCLFAKNTAENHDPSSDHFKKTAMSDLTAFRQGFLCNVLNPKASLFFLAVFTLIIKPDTPRFLEILFIVEMYVIVNAWFCSLTVLLSHPRVLLGLNKIEKYISKALGLFLIGFGIALVFLKQ